MGIVYPNAATSRRWDGALQARLLRAPLEKFLMSRGAVPAPSSLSQDSDNLARATVLILEEGIAIYLGNYPDRPLPAQQAIVGHLACVASHALAHSIARPDAWRIAALVSSAQLLSPWIGLKEAALAAASAARRFYRDGLTIPASDAPIAQAALAAIAPDSTVSVVELSEQVASHLGCDTATACNAELTARNLQARS